MFAVVTAGVTMAFATSKAPESSTLLENGYYFVNTPTPRCINAEVQCTVSDGATCTWTDPATNITHNLRRRVSDAMCGITLQKVN